MKNSNKKNNKSNNSKPSTPTIVGIGASAGGLNALKQFFSKVPEDSGLTYVVVVHLSPEHKSMLSELLQPHSKIPVEQVTKTIPMQPNHVYVIPPGSHLNTIDTHLRLSELEEKRSKRAPIDHFFRTLAKTHDGNSIGIILTGTGSDGALGIKEIKGRNGMIIVQDPNEAEYDGMPQSAIATGMVDFVLPIEKIPEQVMRFAHTKPSIPVVEEIKEVKKDDQQILQKIFAQVRARTGRDFSRYKISTVMRRLQRRMQFYQIANLKDYLDLLRKDATEVKALSDDFLITVTNFFRDKEVFQYLEKTIIPRLFKNKAPDEQIRVWSVGCASGEEAYTLAMLLLEEASRHSASPVIQVFASDLHERSLKMARDGFYPGDIETDVNTERLRKFFTKENGGYRVRKEIREQVIFTPHNLMGDPPFSKLDMIVCRNLLIYLKREVQPDVMELFHYSLLPDGVLVLGTSEHLDTSDLFRTEHKDFSVYIKRNVAGPEPRLPVFPMAYQRHSQETGTENKHEPVSYGMLHQRMVEHYAPPSILIGSEYQVLHISEHAGCYLVHPGGEPTHNIFKLIREELRIELRSTLQAAKDSKKINRSKPVHVKINGNIKHVVLAVKISNEPNRENLALVIFEEQEKNADIKGLIDDKDTDKNEATIKEMEAELSITQQRLQAIIEEYETSQEEMKASNEELQSANEELRSTMEELETSKEELQSVNEELTTVNQENRHKVEELSQLSSDLQNLLSSTDIATLFLDREFRILRFTPRLGELFNVRPADRGRPITDLTHRVGYSNLLEDGNKVLNKLVPIEQEVQDEENNWYICRILPYRSTEDRIEGIVITFIDITSRKRMEDALRKREERLKKMVNVEGVGILIFNNDGTVVDANDAFINLFGYSRKDIQSGTLSWKTFTPREYIEENEKQLDLLNKTDRIGPYEKEYLHKDGTRTWMLFAGATLGDGTFIEYCIDISDRKKAEQQLQESQNHLLETRNLLTMATKASDLGWATWDFQTGDAHWDERGKKIIGLNDQDTKLEDWLNRIHPDDRNRFENHIEECIAEGKSFNLEYRVVHPDGNIRFVHATGAFETTDDGTTLRGTGLVRDITEQKILQQQKDDFMRIAAHELKTPVSVMKGYVNMAENLVRKKGDSQEAGLLKKVDRQIFRLTRLINDLLDVSKMEAGKIELAQEEFDFDQLVNEVVEEMQYINNHQLKLTGMSGKTVRGDRERTGQVITNLITNAAKYSPNAKEIIVNTSTKGDNVYLKVQDFGMGIAEEDLNRVFERFYRIRNDGHKASGLGLGLYISAEIIKRQGGKIWAESEKGNGATFCFSIPVWNG